MQVLLKYTLKLTLAGGQVKGFSPRFKSTTEIMNRSSTGSVDIRFALKSIWTNRKNDISGSEN